MFMKSEVIKRLSLVIFGSERYFTETKLNKIQYYLRVIDKSQLLQ